MAVEEVDDGDNGLPTVRSEITLEGNGFTVERSDSALSDFRILKVEDTGDLTLRNTTVAGGRATAGSFGDRGGAFYNSGTLILDQSTVLSNLARQGGGVFSSGSLHSSDSTFALNVVSGTGGQRFGGAVYQAGFFQAERSLFENNFVGAVGAFPDSGFGGAIATLPFSFTVIVDSTFTGNNVLANDSARGSAVFNNGGATLALVNSTVSQNGTISTPLPSSAVSGTLGGSFALTHVTFSGNRSYAIDGDAYAAATLIANTDGANCSPTTTITGANSIADDASCPTVPSTLTGLDSMLQDNGGPTPTHALLAGSNAVDAAGFCDVETDQRGAPRVGACDVGAFEFMGCPVLILDDDTVDDARVFEDCTITAGPNFAVVGPGGDLTLLFGESAQFNDGFRVEADGRLAVEHDPSLLLVLDGLIEADRARRRAVEGLGENGEP